MSVFHAPINSTENPCFWYQIKCRITLDENCKDKDTLALIRYISDEDKDEKILENQKVLKTPVVRNGKQATVGYQPEIWKEWK